VVVGVTKGGVSGEGQRHLRQIEAMQKGMRTGLLLCPGPSAQACFAPGGQVEALGAPVIKYTKEAILVVEVKLVHPCADMDQSDPEGRYWESDIVMVPLEVLSAWLEDFTGLQSIFTTWNHFLSDKLKMFSDSNLIPF